MNCNGVCSWLVVQVNVSTWLSTCFVSTYMVCAAMLQSLAAEAAVTCIRGCSHWHQRLQATLMSPPVLKLVEIKS